MAKQAKPECEDAKVSVRNARRNTIVELKKLVKDGLSEDLERDAEGEVQNLTDAFGTKIDDLFIVKEKEIMTI